MPHIDYPNVIAESHEQLHDLEKRHRYTHLFQRVRMSRLLPSDGAPSHTSKEVELPENVGLLALPSYSPELNPVERWFQEFRRTLANRVFETIESLQDALTRVLEPYWEEPAHLRSLPGFAWWTEVIDALCHQ